MTLRSFLIPGLLAAGFGPTTPLQQALVTTTGAAGDDPPGKALFRIFRQDHAFTLAGHRSHSSHSSHRSGSGGGGHASHMSHTSHRSSTGGYGGTYDPSPVYVPSAPAPTPSPSASPLLSPDAAEPAKPLPALSGRTAQFTSIVRKVQIGLLGQGVYNGTIDGVVGPRLRASLRAFQTGHGLSVTGTITPQTLDALKIGTTR